MIDFKIKLADICIGIETLYPASKILCHEFFTSEDPEIQIIMTQEDIDSERLISEERGGLPEEQRRISSDAYLETLALYRKIATALIDYEVYLFHGAAIAVDGEVYLFAAKSGTGKTTHMRYWMERFGDRATIVNGDKPLLSIRDNRILVCGTPWCGKEKLGNNMILPLKAVCFLHRDEENHIQKVEAKDFLPKLLNQTFFPEDAAKKIKTINFLDFMTRNIPFYSLGCTMDPSSADISYHGMQE